MQDFFLMTLDRSLSACWIVLAVILCRLMLKKAPRWLLCGLWALVALRLLCPFTLESMLSLVPRQTIVEEATAQLLDDYVGPTHTYFDIASEYETAVEAGIPTFSAGEDNHHYVVTGQTPTTPPKTLSDILPHIWLTGMGLLLLYASFSYLRLRRRVCPSICLGNGIYLCDYIDTPFLLGLIRPKIYLPSNMDPADTAHVLAHERAHLKRRDHWWKPLGFLLLTLHWFNPLLWLAYVLLCRDIELACDERVIRDLDALGKKAYSEALLKCSVKRHMIAACPLAFGEVSVKQRIRSVLHYKKPGFWIMLTAVLAVLALAVCFLTEQPDPDPLSPFEEDLWITELIYSEDGEPLHNAPANVMGTLDLSLNQNTFTTFDSNFLETQLTQENFDALFDTLGQWNSLSAKTLRQQNKNVWVLHDTADYSHNANSHKFYYLLQQRNGDLYLTQGVWWDAQLRPGKTTIAWVFRMGKAEVSNPFQDGDTPFSFTRTIDTQHLETTGWLPIIYPQLSSPADAPEDGSIFCSDLINLLHTIPEDSFQLADPMESPELRLTLDLANSDIFDVELRYGGGKVEMGFHPDATWSFAKTGSQVWRINHQCLVDCLARYSPSFSLPEYLRQPLDLHTWRKQITISDIRSVAVSILTPLRYNYGYHMGTGAAERLLQQLRSLPDSAFLPTDFDLNVYEQEEAGCISIDWDHGVFPTEDQLFAQIVWLHDQLYLFFREQIDSAALQAWEIRDPDFLTWQSAFYDPTHRHGFHVMESPIGTISVSHGNASIQLNTYSYMNYEIIEYTDDATPFGIRMQPKITDSGWISILYYPGGFTPDPELQYSSEGSHGNYSFTQYTAGSRSADSAVLYTGLAGDYVRQAEGLQLWTEEFYFDSSELYNGMLLADGLLTREEILDIVRPLLPFTGENLNYIRLEDNSVWRKVEVSFDDRSGLWTVCAAATQTQEEVPLLTLDVHGNVFQQFWFPG